MRKEKKGSEIEWSYLLSWLVVKKLTLTVLETEGCRGNGEAGISARGTDLQGLRDSGDFVTCLFCWVFFVSGLRWTLKKSVSG